LLHIELKKITNYFDKSKKAITTTKIHIFASNAEVARSGQERIKWLEIEL
jgi:hypothetical protein